MSKIISTIRFSGSQIVISLWVLTFCILTGHLMYFFFSPQEEWLGTLAFGGIVLSCLLNIENFFSLLVLKGSEKFAKVMWTSFFVCIVLIGIWAEDLPNGEVGIFFVYCMLILSFPLGLLWALSIFGVSYLLWSSSGELSFFIPGWVVGVGFFVTGYFQWFIALPYLISKTRVLREFFIPIRAESTP